jgi:imidazolonepropionase-like amidohydrolase
VLTRVEVVDFRQPPQHGATVIVQGDRIASIGHTPFERRDNDIVVDLQGKTLMPGMVSCHFHADYRGLSVGTGRTPALERRRGVAMVNAVVAAQSLLASGFTGYVGAGCSYGIDQDLKTAVEEGVVAGPRILAGSGYIPMGEGVERALGAVRKEVELGATVMKVFLTGGHGTPETAGTRQFDRRELEAVVGSSRDHGCVVRAHVVYRDEILEALECGVTVIDHGDGADQQCFELMLDRGAFWVPSAMFNKAMASTLDRQLVDLALHDAAMRDLGRQSRSICQANGMGVKIVPGDDYGTELLPHRPGGYARELSLYAHELGCGSTNVLRWATTNGNELLSLGSEGDPMSERSLADFCVLNGDPIRDIEILQDPWASIAAVFRGGQCVYRGSSALTGNDP